MNEIDDSIVINLLSSLVLSLLMSITDQIPAHQRKARAIKKVEESLRELAQLNSQPLSGEMVTVGVTIWNRCIEELQHAVLKLESNIEYEEHPLLFQYDRNGVCTTVSYHYINE